MPHSSQHAPQFPACPTVPSMPHSSQHAPQFPACPSVPSMPLSSQHPVSPAQCVWYASSHCLYCWCFNVIPAQTTRRRWRQFCFNGRRRLASNEFYVAWVERGIRWHPIVGRQFSWQDFFKSGIAMANHYVLLGLATSTDPSMGNFVSAFPASERTCFAS